MRTVRHGLLLRVTDADLGAFAASALRLLTSDAAASLTRRAESYTLDAGGSNNLPNGALLAFTGSGLPDGLELDVRREVDACELERVVVTFTGPDDAADAFEETFHRELARMSRAEVAALEALGRVPALPETMGFAYPDRALGWELARVDPKHVEVVTRARDALALVASDGPRSFWLGVVRVKLGDLERGAADLSIACAAAPASSAIAVTTARVLLDLGRNREVVGLLSPLPPTRPPTERSELLALAWLRLGRPEDALSALEGARGVARARLLDATGDCDGAVRELRHAFLASAGEARRFQEGVTRPHSQLASVGVGTTLGVLIDEDWVLEMWGDPRVSLMLKTDFSRDVRGYMALLAVEDIAPFARDMDAAEDVAPAAVDVAAATKVEPASREKLERALGLLRRLPDVDAFPGMKLRTALLSMMLGRREDALRLFEDVHARWPTHAAARRGLWHFALSPQIEAHGVTYAATSVPRTEEFAVVARTGSHVDWEQRVAIQIMPTEVRLALEEDARRLTLELDGEHPRGGEEIRERVFFDATTGDVLGREGRAR